MATPTHREQAETLLAQALEYPLTTATRGLILAEAQVHATLATLDAAAPQRTTRSSAKPAAPKEASA
jgi:hypothetical protein